MITLVWRQVEPVIRTQWRGPEGRVARTALTVPLPQLAAIIGPPGERGASALGGVATITLPSGRGVREWRESVAAPGVTKASRVQLGLAPVSDTQENDPELLFPIALWARPAADAIHIGAAFAHPVAGAVSLIWSAT